MNKKQYEELAERRFIYPANYCVRHDNGEYFEVKALTKAKVRKLIERKVQERGWQMKDVDWFEVNE